MTSAAAAEGPRLRPAGAADREFLARTYASARAEELAPVPWTDAEKDAFLRQQFEAQDLHYRTYYPTSESLVIRTRGQPVGRLYVDRTTEEIRVMDIALLPQHRGRGIGRELIGALQAEAEAAGIPVTLHVEAHNPAQRLYARLGFTFVEDRGVYQFLQRRPATTGRGGVS